MQLRFGVALACALALLAGAAAAATRGPAVSSVQNSVLGKILVGAGGRTLYDSTVEKRGTVVCIGSCTTHWLPLVSAEHLRPVAGAGVHVAMLGMVKRPDGRWQVTYRGHPLYLFSGDVRAGQVNGQGVAGQWHAVSPSGLAVMTSAQTAMPPTGTTAGAGSSGDSGSSTGSGPPPGANVGMWCAANPKSCVNGVPVQSGQ